MQMVHTIIDIDGTAHKVTQAGLLFVYGDKSTAAAPTLLADAEKVPDYGRTLKRPKAIRDRLRQLGYQTETIYDATHGRRYMMIAYGFIFMCEPFGKAQRRTTMGAASGIMNLRQHHIDAGCSAEDLDALA